MSMSDTSNWKAPWVLGSKFLAADERRSTARFGKLDSGPVTAAAGAEKHGTVRALVIDTWLTFSELSGMGMVEDDGTESDHGWLRRCSKELRSARKLRSCAHVQYSRS